MFSTPSATIFTCMSLPSEMMSLASALSLGSFSMNARSILTQSIANSCRRARFEYPVPKSSTEIVNPRPRSWSIMATEASLRSMSMDSVSSSSIRRGSQPASASASSTVATKVPVTSWRCETLTEIDSGKPWSCQSRCWRIATRMTWVPRSSIRPEASQAGMNTEGGIIPRWGWFHRASASAPTIEAFCRDTRGW